MTLAMEVYSEARIDCAIAINYQLGDGAMSDNLTEDGAGAGSFLNFLLQGQAWDFVALFKIV
jgi:hypothetical protein